MYNIRYFDTIEKAEQVQAETLAEILTEMYNPGSVADVGCATGIYLWPFHINGVETIGFDSADYAVENKVVPTVQKADITNYLLTKKYDLAICLEVLEHIENDLGGGVIQNLVNMTDTIIFSAAQPGQKGTGHINCKPKKHWEMLFKVRGYEKDVQAEKKILDHVTKQDHAEWFKNNLQVFRKVQP